MEAKENSEKLELFGLFIENYEKCSYKEKMKEDILKITAESEPWFRKILQTYWSLFKKFDPDFSINLFQKICETSFSENETLSLFIPFLKKFQFDTFPAISQPSMPLHLQKAILKSLESSKWRERIETQEIYHELVKNDKNYLTILDPLIHKWINDAVCEIRQISLGKLL